MKRFFALVASFLMLAGAAFAQTEGSATGGTAGTRSALAGCIYNSSAPTLSTGQQVGCQVDASGNLLISGSISATNPSVAATAGAVPASGTYIAGNKGGVLTGVTLDSSNYLQVNCVVGCTAPAVGNGTSAAATRVTLSNDGTGVIATVGAVTTITNPVTVTDGAGALNVIVDSGTTAVTQATAANLNAQVVGDAAAGAADSGNPVKAGGVYNSTLPTLTNAQRGNLQLTNRGSLEMSMFYTDGTPITAGVDNADAVVVSGTLNKLIGVSRGTVFNGTTWDRQYGNTAGAYAQGNAASAAADAGNPVKVGGKYNSTLPTFTDGQRGDVQVGTRGSLSVQLMAADSATQIGSGAVADGQTNATVGIFTDDRGLQYNGASWDLPGSATCRIVTGTTGFCKAAAGVLYSVTVQNLNAAVRYLQIYNKASAPTLSTDTPILTIPLPAASITNLPLGNFGVRFTTGIAWAYTTDDVAIPVTAATSAEMHATLGYR